MIFTYTSFDCVDYRPTTFNFCILSRFSSSEACTYRSNVIVTEACPNISDNDLTSILVAFNLLRWLHDSSVRISRKALLIGLAALFFVAIFAIVFLNAFGIQDELLSLKIVRRLLYGDKSSRFKTWTSYLFSGDWLRYPFGGQKSEFAYHGEWVHNLWLDILNKVGLIPFVIAVIFTITSIRSAYGAAVRMKKANHNLLSNQIASLGLGALLICMPEPVVDANPYFFFAILMLLGGIKGVECSFGKEDTAESERGF